MMLEDRQSNWDPTSLARDNIYAFFKIVGQS